MERDEASVRKLMNTISKAMVETHEATVYKPEICKTLRLVWQQLDTAFCTTLRALHQAIDEKGD